MYINYFGTILFIIAAWVVGLATIKSINLEKKNPEDYGLIAFPIGISCFAVVSALLYLRLLFSIRGVRVGLCLLFVISVIFLIKNNIKKEELYTLLFFIICVVLVSLFGLFAGQKYFVHRGNIWDHYFYISEVIYMSLHPFSYGLNPEVPLSDVLSFGYRVLEADRPTVPLLCAVLCGKGWGNVFFQAYLFKTMMWVSIEFAMTFVIKRSIKANGSVISRISFFVIAFAYSFGFYGQISNDIDSWPQLTSMACLLTYVFTFVIIYKRLLKGGIINIREYVFLLIIGSGCFLIYPENTMIHAALVALMGITLLIFKHNSFKMRNFWIIVSLPIMISILVGIIDFSTLKCAIFQLETGNDDVRQTWAEYFDRYWDGYFLFVPGDIKGLELMKRAVNFSLSVFGMFIIAPDYGISSIVLRYVWIAFAVFLCICIMAVFIRTIIKVVKTLRNKRIRYETAIHLFALEGLFFFGFFLLAHKSWSAGKMLLYISPYLFLAMLNPLSEFVRKRHKQESRMKGKKVNAWILHCFVIIFLSTQIIFAGMRMVNIFTNKAGTGFLGNYPSDQMPELKETYSYDFNAKDFKGCKLVEIRTEDDWYQSFLELSLAYEDISYYSVPDILFYDGGYGNADIPDTTPDAVIIP